MSAYLFSGFTLLAIPILIPLNVVNGGGQEGLRSMTIGNVVATWRLWFHLVLSVIFSGATIFMLWREMLEYTRRRHAYLLSAEHAKTPQSTTILVTAIPEGLHSEEALFDIFNRFPGGVRSIWLNRDPKALINLCQERDETALKLEAAEYEYVRSAYVVKSKKETTIQEPQRPIGRTSSIPFVGPKVDLIEFYSNRLEKLNKEIEETRQKQTVCSLNSAFIQFHTQFAAHSAVQTVVHPTPFRMAPMFAEISPLDVVWDNMNLNTLNRKGRSIISTTLATGLALTWSIPVAFVSSIASISAIAKITHLQSLNDLPGWLVGIIQGILPPLFLGILMALLPIILTLLSKFEGHVRYSSITLAVMSKYFVFLIINVLLISTFSGGILTTIANIKGQGFQPLQIMAMIANSLPAVSTFFVTYAMLQGFSGPVMELLQITPLVLNYAFTILLAKSPRQVWNVQGRLGSVNYGIIFPLQTLMFAVGMLYCVLAPLVLPFVSFYFALFYFVYRHNFLYVYKQTVETGGLAFPLAVKQAYTGLFIFEVTMICFYVIRADPTLLPHIIIMLILLIATIFSYTNLNEAFNPLVTFLPVALFSKDLQINKDGIVSDGSKNTALIQDDETGLGEKRPITTMDSVPTKDYSSEKASLAVLGGKREYDESAEVSSQLPGVPTPNPSMLDSTSISHQSRRPAGMDRIDSHKDRAVSFVASSYHADVDTEHADEDPELRRLQEQAYCHPAMYSPQIPIWLPLDQRGLVTEEINRLASMGITVATTGAGLDPVTGKTHVSGIVFAPGEEASYRLERGE
ncbi:hypothetical protein BGX26_001910 [Mortierella sp. AD094]|nr:hypothetical protein BGX26_001910 [Mortierella sp. AD094]